MGDGSNYVMLCKPDYKLVLRAPELVQYPCKLGVRPLKMVTARGTAYLAVFVVSACTGNTAPQDILLMAL